MPHQDFIRESHDLRQAIDRLPQHARIDLYTIWRHMEHVRHKLAAEQVNCRRRKSNTAQWVKLMSDYQEVKQVLEEHIVLAVLCC